ncbi:carbohydrate porin [uncultured Methylobacterium sp.]|uniref:carbohydrate porin n=1 Tax=uncultured Methylobacterium sp. TaxID=157278 RepID=UPI0035CA50B3
MPRFRTFRPWISLLLALAGACGATAAEVPRTASLPEIDLAPRFDVVASLAERVRTGRAALKDRGIEVNATYIGEVFSNRRGGMRRGTAYEGRLDAQVDADLDTLMGLDGLSFHSNAYQIHGTDISRYYVGNLATVSGIEALPATRLHELWLEQAFLDKALTVRAGRLAADAEFLVSPSATVFINQTFGWPVIAMANLPSGGPASPFATPGIRAKWSPSDRTTLMVGLFNGDPAPPRAGNRDLDPQRRSPDGVDFPLQVPPLLIAEAAHRYVVDAPGPERTGTVKLGYYHHFGRFDDPRFDLLGRSLADPSSGGIARRRRGNDGVYALVDQTLYREDADSDRGAATFLRIAGSPNEASVVDLYGDAGLVYKGLLPGRPADVAGISVSYMRIGGAARGYDRDRIAFEGIAMPVRRYEAVVELTYQAVVAPGFTIQPDLQYVRFPGGNTWNPRRNGFVRMKDSAVVGVRATIQF